MTYGNYLKYLPEYAEARKEMAALYRSARKQNPKMARLLYKRLQKATDLVADKFWSEGTVSEGSGLRALVS